jgi:hypothetical protein
MRYGIATAQCDSAVAHWPLGQAQIADSVTLPSVTVPLSAAHLLPGSGRLPTAGGVTVSCSARLTGHYHLGVARPVPENTFSRTAREQHAHLAGKVVKTISEQVRRRG